MASRRYRALNASLALGAVVLLAVVMYRSRSSQPPLPVTEGATENPGPSLEARRDSLRVRLRKTNEPTFLIESLRDLPEDLRKDREIIQLYRSNLQHFSAEELALISRSWRELVYSINEFIAEKDDPKFVAAFLDGVRSNALIRNDLLYRLGSKSPLLAPGEINGTLKIFSGEDELGRVGSGLASRIATKSGEGAKIAEADKYLATVAEPAVAAYVVGARVKLMRFSEATGWLLSIDSDKATIGDRNLLKDLGRDDLKAAIEFANQLIERGDSKRSTKAIEALVEGYGSLDPREAFDWVQSLPGELRTSQTDCTALFKLAMLDPGHALAIVDAQQDPKTKDRYRSVVAAALEVVNRSKEKKQSAVSD